MALRWGVASAASHTRTDRINQDSVAVAVLDAGTQHERLECSEKRRGRQRRGRLLRVGGVLRRGRASKATPTASEVKLRPSSRWGPHPTRLQS